jgi:hypothetical protein
MGKKGTLGKKVHFSPFPKVGFTLGKCFGPFFAPL